MTQRKLATYLVENDAHYVFTVKDNQRTLGEAIRLVFQGRGEPDFTEPLTLAHGRIEQRSIWTTTRLNDYLDFPGVGQVFVIERPTIENASHYPSSASGVEQLRRAQYPVKARRPTAEQERVNGD